MAETKSKENRALEEYAGHTVFVAADSGLRGGFSPSQVHYIGKVQEFSPNYLKLNPYFDFYAELDKKDQQEGVLKTILFGLGITSEKRDNLKRDNLKRTNLLKRLQEIPSGEGEEIIIPRERIINIRPCQDF